MQVVALNGVEALAPLLGVVFNCAGCLNTIGQCLRTEQRCCFGTFLFSSFSFFRVVRAESSRILVPGILQIAVWRGEPVVT